MFTVVETIHINKSPSEVYDYLLNPNNYAKWISDVKVIRASAPFKAGETFEEVTLFQGQEKLSVGKVLEIQYSQKLILQITSIVSGPKLMPIRTFTLQPANGGTDLAWQTQVKVGGMMRLFQPFLPKMFHTKTQDYLKVLKQCLEVSA